jgi:hypothetical protein
VHFFSINGIQQISGDIRDYQAGHFYNRFATRKIGPYRRFDAVTYPAGRCLRRRIGFT